MISLDTSAFRSISPLPPKLRAGEVHLWMADLGDIPKRLRETLSPDEWVRSSRFHFLVDRDRYVATRALVRTILAAYLGEDPSALRFANGSHGKPALIDSRTFMRFNLSHSDDLMLLAVTFGREVGVDLEAIRDHVHYEMLAEHYFSPEDQWALRITPTPHRCRRFFELWTRAEARLKARGVGLSEDAPAPNLYDYTVRSLEPAAGYAAAIAVEGDASDLTFLRWQN